MTQHVNDWVENTFESVWNENFIMRTTKNTRETANGIAPIGPEDLLCVCER